MRTKHKLISGAAAALVFAGVGTAAALAGSAGATTPPANAPSIAPAKPAATVVPEPTTAGAPDTDTLQQGDQTAPDPAVGAKAAVPASESSAPETETPAPAEAGTPDGPGGHQDSGANVDYQFQGEQ